MSRDYNLLLGILLLSSMLVVVINIAVDLPAWLDLRCRAGERSCPMTTAVLPTSDRLQRLDGLLRNPSALIGATMLALVLTLALLAALYGDRWIWSRHADAAPATIEAALSGQRLAGPRT